ncbi:MAG: DUF3471 domain-containing protein [Pseudomonadota bacterium]
MLVDGHSVDLIQQHKESFNKRLADATEALSNVTSAPEGAAAPTLPLEAYAGVYHDKWYGDVTITHGPEGLAIDMSRSELLDGPLTPFDGDQFVAIWPNPSLKADAFVNFSVEDGAVTGMTMNAVSDITDFSYDFHDLNLKKVKDSQ